MNKTVSGRKLGILVSLSKVDKHAEISPHVSHGCLTASFHSRRIFSTGKVTIGSFKINTAKIVWDTGSKVTIVFVPDPDALDAPPLGIFDVSGIGTSETASSRSCTIDLGGGIIIDGICAGMLPDSGDIYDDDTVETADVILGMDVLELGNLNVNGPLRKWSFKT